MVGLSVSLILLKLFPQVCEYSTLVLFYYSTGPTVYLPLYPSCVSWKLRKCGQAKTVVITTFHRVQKKYFVHFSDHGSHQQSAAQLQFAIYQLQYCCMVSLFSSFVCLYIFFVLFFILILLKMRRLFVVSNLSKKKLYF